MLKILVFHRLGEATGSFEWASAVKLKLFVNDTCQWQKCMCQFCWRVSIWNWTMNHMTQKFDWSKLDGRNRRWNLWLVLGFSNSKMCCVHRSTYTLVQRRLQPLCTDRVKFRLCKLWRTQGYVIDKGYVIHGNT